MLLVQDCISCREKTFYDRFSLGIFFDLYQVIKLKNFISNLLFLKFYYKKLEIMKWILIKDSVDQEIAEYSFLLRIAQ